MARDLGLYAYEELSGTVSEIIAPTLEVNPQLIRRAEEIFSSNTTGTGGITLVSARPGQKFVMNSVCLTFAKDATCDLATGVISVTGTIKGVSASVIGMSHLTLTAQQTTATLSFPRPIVFDANTIISVSALSFTVGTCASAGRVTGWFEEATI